MRKSARMCGNMLVATKEKFFIVEDELLIKRIEKLKINNEVVEVDTVHLDTYFWDKVSKKRIKPKLCLLLNENNKKLIRHKLLKEKDDDIEEMFTLTIDYMQKMGKPKEIIVRNQEAYYQLFDLCKKLNVSLRVEERLKEIDEFIRCKRR